MATLEPPEGDRELDRMPRRTNVKPLSYTTYTKIGVLEDRKRGRLDTRYSLADLGDYEVAIETAEAASEAVKVPSALLLVNHQLPEMRKGHIHCRHPPIVFGVSEHEHSLSGARAKPTQGAYRRA